MLSDEQAKAVDQVLARYETYIKRLGQRVAAKGVRPPHPLPSWIERTEWHLNGLRHHFAEWARGAPGAMNGSQQSVPTWVRATRPGEPDRS